MTFQLDLPLQEESQSKAKQACQIRVGDCFLRNNEILMRIKPTHWMLNSNLIVDAINNNKVFVSSIFKGTFWAIPGSDLVIPVDVKAKIQLP